MPPQPSQLPTHSQLSQFLSAFLPPAPNDVPFLYHAPRHPAYSSSTAPISNIVLGITPTAGVYALLSQPDAPFAPLCFLHRPWTLDRRALRRGTLVLASHVSFDAHLTVGWNVALAERLGLSVADAVCIQGYKGDAERRIGIVARLRADAGASLGSITEQVRLEFAGVGALHVHVGSAVKLDSEIGVVAIMNAFHAEEVDRVLSAARSEGWIDDANDGGKLLYLTGAAREHGLAAAAISNMPVVCVGHRVCEEWGIRFLAEKLRERWPAVVVQEVLEEEPRMRKKKDEDAGGAQGVAVN